MQRVFTFASTRFRAFVILTALWSAIGWVTKYLRPLDLILGVELPAWVQIPGIVAIVAGAALVLVCGVILSIRGIGTLHGEEWFMPREFVATGPFRFVRNPMSLGGALLMAGIALWHRSTLCLGLAAALFLVFHLVAARLEEPGLEKRFGESYRQYRRNVPRWVPRITPWQGSSAELKV
jgi:protein-S-isoprenylcysteine O-methyltransferase Ste14